MIRDKPGKAFGQLLEAFLPQHSQFIGHNLSGGTVFTSECSDVKSVEEGGCFIHAELYQDKERLAIKIELNPLENHLNLVPFGSVP